MRFLFVSLLLIIGCHSIGNAQKWTIEPERTLDFGKIERAGIIQTYAVITSLGA
jgi:hypothetical protein